jgi:hypothetical protein
MLFGSRNDCEPPELNEQLAPSNSTPNPNVICFLDGTIITRSNLIENADGHSLGALELDPLRQNNHELGLVEINFSGKDKSGQALATLMLGIIRHLSLTRLKDPHSEKYTTLILEGAAHTGDIIRMPNSCSGTEA